MQSCARSGKADSAPALVSEALATAQGTNYGGASQSEKRCADSMLRGITEAF